MKPTHALARVPRILLVEDDPVSRAFLAAAAESLPAQIDTAASCAQALQIAAATPGHALWLIDAHLPDGSGSELLAGLRIQAPQTPALAHTASRQDDAIQALIDAGFVDVLLKPIPTSVLQMALRRTLGLSASAAAVPDRLLADWDEHAALVALKGERSHVANLRRLFLDELPQQRQSIATALAAGDIKQASDILHRLRASCGFVGAARLGEAVRRLQSEPDSVEASRCFHKAASDLIESA